MPELIQRQKNLLNILTNKKYIRVKEIAENFGVSQETIRRDLEVLERLGYVVRSHGGATYRESTMQTDAFELRGVRHQAEKKAIAAAAAEFINDNDVIVVLGASTTFYLAPYILARKNITLLTNDIKLGMAVSEGENTNVLFMGGRYVPAEYCTWGDDTVDVLGRYHPDKAFFSSTGVSLKDGMTTYHTGERNLIQRTVEMAQESYLLVDHTKFSRIGLYTTHGLPSVTATITDWRTPKKVLDEFHAKGYRILTGKRPVSEEVPFLNQM